MLDTFDFADDLGPSKIIHVYEPSIDLRAVLVVDNIAKGPARGGIRMAEDVTTAECFRLARAMTFKNAAADLPHGGGKIVVRGDPRMPKGHKSELLRALAKSLRNVDEYIFAPDMGTDEECMAWIRDEVGRVVALPREIGGIPLDEIGATGWGLSHAVDVARLTTLKDEGRSVTDYPGARTLDRDAVVGIPCDIWIPAARPDVVDEDNVAELKARLVVQGANIPFTPGAERQLHERGVLCVPDFIANAVGVICAALEYQGAGESAVFQTIADKIRRNTTEVLERSRREGILPRRAAIELAEQRVRKAMSYRRWSLFSSAPGFV